MERTLSLPVLQSALGPLRTSTLPSPEELMRLIAGIEVRAMMHRLEVDEAVLRTAWYLHGVTALPEAAELYSPARQRHAFAVSAHIFDLALADEERPTPERLSLAFGAQIGYRRCSQEPNATAVWRRVAELCHGPDPLSLDLEERPLAALDAIETLSLEAGVAFLGFDTGRLWDLLRHWRRQLGELQGLLGLDHLQSTLFGPTQDVVNAVADLTNYLVFGARDRLRRAEDALERVVSGRSGRGDINAQWVAAHLLRLLGDLRAGSLHELLPPDGRQAVAQAFTLTSPPVLTLWQPQRELLSRGAANPLDPATGRLLVSVPTSAGKSLISQLIMCSHLASVPGRAIYVSPLRSLAREMRRSLRERLRVLDREMDADIPDFPSSWHLPGEDDESADVEVITPERLMHALRNDPEQALQDVTLIVVDEAHHMAQGRRGFLLEGLLAFCQTYPDAPRLVLLSAAVGNGAALASWLSPGAPEVLFTSAWRGPRRLHGLLSTTASWEEKVTTRRRSAGWPWQTTVPLSVDISLRPAESMTPIQLSTTRVGELVLKHREETSLRECEKDKNKSTAAYKMFAAAATLLLPAGAMLVVAGTRDRAQSTALAMAEHLPEYGPAVELAQLFAEQLGEEHPLIGCTRRGVAFHHAALPDDVLEAVEDGLRGGRLLAVASTSTLTDGVNLPVRTVLITADLDHDQASDRATGSPGLDAARLLNAVGRAGRAGQESEGWILLALSREIDAEDYDLFSPSNEQLQVRSALADHTALEALAAAESAIATSADGVLAVAQGMAADFISFVWFVLDAHAHLEAGMPNPLGVVDRLLAMQQLPEPARERWRALAQITRTRYNAANPATRRRWTSTGTSLLSARTLDDLARRVARRVLVIEADVDDFDLWSRIEPEELSLAKTLRILEEERVYEVLLQLPERERAWQFHDRRRGKNRQAVNVDIVAAIRAWIAGTSIPAMARQWLPNADIDWALEQAVSNISVTFEHYLSWTLGALINMVNEQLTSEFAPVRLRTTTAWCVRYGVDTDQALNLLVHGIRSRTLAYRIGRQADAENVPLTSLTTWLAAQHLPGWQDRYGPTALETDDLLEYVRKRRRSLLRALLAGRNAELTVETYPAGGATQTSVNLMWTDTKPASEILVTDQYSVRGRIAAHDHSDIAAVLRSGLVIDASLNGSILLLRHSAAEQ
ncbi:DEAD/DEAH box helicase [Kitasatospora sp. NPDC057500]|uniref:DEAD/DEAH box helicase n=1 Tax=Kitasatospora sp. NPDC057500 TaxID=3346151 RepID=UPI0036C46AC3